jgi:hypothetical protein
MKSSTTPADRNEHWTTLQDCVESLAMKVDYHWQQATSNERSELEQVAKRIGAALEDAAAGIRNASTDPAIRDDLQKVGAAFESAVTTTLGNISEGVRDFFESRTPPTGTA